MFNYFCTLYGGYYLKSLNNRFDGVAPEPRKGIRSGHVPGSKCIPFGQVTELDTVLFKLKLVFENG